MQLMQSNEVQSPRLGTFAKSPTSSPVIGNPGRGGSGNHTAAAEAHAKAKSQKDQEDRIAAEKRREQVEQEVSSILQAPPGAWLGGRRRSSVTAAEDGE